jgi:endonuclease/exonuclease/phosphatase (EEP) superfamily protein YafD
VTLARRLHLLPPVLIALAFVHPVVRRFARWDWRLDLISHFREPALALTCLAIAAALLTRRKAAAVVLAVLAMIQVEPIARFSLPNPVTPADSSGARIRILMANVLADNENYDLLARWIEEVDPEIVGLVEVTDGWVEGLKRLEARYPYRVDAPNGTRGLSLWFKTKPARIDPPAIAIRGGGPYLHAVFSFEGADRHLWLVHPSSPFRRGDVAGFAELDALARTINGVEGSKIVIGDFNTTDGSPFFHDFAAATGLRDSRLGFGRQPSWPAGGIYQIAIDHAFVTDDLAVTARRQGPSNGSDHLPFWIELAPAARRPASASAAHSSARPR